jgi:hypothetical protein
VFLEKRRKSSIEQLNQKEGLHVWVAMDDGEKEQKKGLHKSHSFSFFLVSAVGKRVKHMELGLSLQNIQINL